MQSVTIIGLGWLGLPLAEFLAGRGWQVSGSKRTADQQNALAKRGITLYPFELGSRSIPNGLCNSQAMVIAVPPNRADLIGYQQGIKRLVKQAILQKVRQIIFISSTSILPQRAGRFDENSKPEADNATSNILIELEHWLGGLAIETDILRLAGLVGKQRHPAYALAGKSQLANANQPVNLVHLQDCIQAIYTLLCHPNGQRLYHLCAPLHPTRSDYYRRIARRLGLADLHFLADNAPLDRVILATKIERELGFRYQFPDPDSMI
ncbi:hypothetical protein RO21_05770 [[Actinobacillus] muris]|uniref:6-phosphogluconate dehydrogenase NADP-binding domain-containing protein n=1 Tax=Muribacter muris TaxID=67855 RepID=A0A0J5P5G4_9PAST|nr:NAD(P)-binding domain-containing protein [Muribacter muris]KMK51511.1 hypothetical protein RO21_05770 [[Actinobacillus] muris] [Muribacter muris]